MKYYKSHDGKVWHCTNKERPNMVEITKEEWDAHIKQIKKSK